MNMRFDSYSDFLYKIMPIIGKRDDLFPIRDILYKIFSMMLDPCGCTNIIQNNDDAAQILHKCSLKWNYLGIELPILDHRSIKPYKFALKTSSEVVRTREVYIIFYISNHLPITGEYGDKFNEV